jgi:hypothetical protein
VLFWGKDRINRVNQKFLGDSYDIVKQSFLRWLAGMGTWATHPMFTESISTQQANAFSGIIGTRLLSLDILTPDADRDAYLAPARDCNDHVFLDPDTGIRLKPTTGLKAPLYIFGTELVAIAAARPERLILVFDQSLGRGKEGKQLKNKLAFLENQGVLGIAYLSHACFVLMSKNSSILEAALKTLKRESLLPENRFLSCGSH